MGNLDAFLYAGMSAMEHYRRFSWCLKSEFQSTQLKDDPMPHVMEETVEGVKHIPQVWDRSGSRVVQWNKPLMRQFHE